MELLPQLLKIGTSFQKRTSSQVTRKCQNEFFCGLHFLVGLADQAQACLKLWENILLKGQSIGSLVHGGYSNGESGTIHLIRMICKAVSH